MVSEDSQKPGWLSSVHRLSDFRNLGNPFHRQMRSPIHQIEHTDKLLEVLLFRGSQRIFAEERHYLFAQIIHRPNAVAMKILTMVINPAVDKDVAALKEVLEGLQRRETSLPLCDDELRQNLPACARPRIAIDADRKASFAIHEPYDPSDSFESFLLIVCTGQIVTHDISLRSYCQIHQTFQHTAGFY